MTRQKPKSRRGPRGDVLVSCDRKLLEHLREALPKGAHEAPIIDGLINRYLDEVSAQDRAAVRAGIARKWRPNRKPARPYQCSRCLQVGHNRSKCQTGKAPLIVDSRPFDVQEDIREECLALSWLSVQRVTA